MNNPRRILTMLVAGIIATAVPGFHFVESLITPAVEAAGRLRPFAMKPRLMIRPPINQTADNSQLTTDNSQLTSRDRPPTKPRRKAAAASNAMPARAILIQRDRPTGLHRLSRRQRRCRRHAPRMSGRLVRTHGPDPPTPCAPTPCSTTKPRVHPLRQPRRSAHRPHQLRHRRLPRQQDAARSQEHDDARLHALGRGPVQQRRRPATSGPLRRKLQHERRAAAHADRAAADRRGDARRRACCPTSTRCRASRSRSRATSCASSSAAAAFVPKSASPTATRSPAGRGPASACAAWAPRTAPTRSSSACTRRVCSTRR